MRKEARAASGRRRSLEVAPADCAFRLAQLYDADVLSKMESRAERCRVKRQSETLNEENPTFRATIDRLKLHADVRPSRARRHRFNDVLNHSRAAGSDSSISYKLPKYARRFLRDEGRQERTVNGRLESVRSGLLIFDPSDTAT